MKTKVFEAIVTSNASKIMEKVSGAKYVIHNIEFTENGPLKGKITGAAHTLYNSKEKEKAPLKIGDSVLAYLHFEKKEDKSIPRFEIDRNKTATEEEILLALAYEETDQKI